MVRGTIEKEIIDKVKKYKQILEGLGISVERVILFGSRAKGTARKESGIDLAIVSRQFGVDDLSIVLFL